MPSERTTRTLVEQLARDHGADFREVVLLDDREAAFERFDRRAREDDDPVCCTAPASLGITTAPGRRRTTSSKSSYMVPRRMGPPRSPTRRC
jgi:hypothetical protein